MNSHKAQLEVGARSETGYIRDENQDRMSGTQVLLGQLYIVADGMGGHKGGGIAAELTVQGLQQHLGEAHANVSIEEAIHTAFQKTNELVYQKAYSGDPATEGMGSTAVLVLISERVARVAHVGDSRAYLYREGRLKQLTTDHTLVQKMVNAGMLKPEEASDHPHASVLERAIGNKPDVQVDISEQLPLNEGDAILLCSDGLSGYVADSEIEAVLQGQATVQEIPERLVNLALQKGGADNVTVQFIQYGTREDRQLRKTKELKQSDLTKTKQAQRSLFQSFLYGIRKRMQPLKMKAPETSASVSVRNVRHPPFLKVAALVLGAVIIAVVFYGVFYYFPSIEKPETPGEEQPEAARNETSSQPSEGLPLEPEGEKEQDRTLDATE